MRQPSNENKIDPFKPIGTEAIPSPALSPAFQQDHKRWANNTAITRQHKFCASLCVNFKGLGGIQANEASCMNTCFSKYGQAFVQFGEEKQHFLGSLADLALRGEDKYAAKDI